MFLSLPSGQHNISGSCLSIKVSFYFTRKHIGGADNWTRALFFYIRFKGKYFSIFLDGLCYCITRTKPVYEHIKVDSHFGGVNQTNGAALHPAV